MVVIVLTTLSAQFKHVAPTSWRESRCTIYFIGITVCHYKPEEVFFPVLPRPKLLSLGVLTVCPTGITRMKTGNCVWQALAQCDINCDYSFTGRMYKFMHIKCYNIKCI